MILFASVKSESLHPSHGQDVGEGTQDSTQDRLDQLENDIHNLLLDNDSNQMIVFPTSVVYLLDVASSQRC